MEIISAITSYDEIVKALRSETITQSGLNSNNVINADSVRGPDLLNIINSLETYSISLNDAFIVFRLAEDSANDTITTEENDETLSTITYYNYEIKLYGNISHTLIQQLFMRFKSVEVKSKLADLGIIITGVNNPTFIDEFINNTVWPRCDMTIDLVVRYSCNKITTDPEVKALNKILVKKV